MSRPESALSLLITAEHASRAVPARWRSLFAGQCAVLDSHRAWDPGTRMLAQELAAELNAPLLSGQVSRLLVDLNRSASHPRVFSEFSRILPASAREDLMERYWRPHWQAYRQSIERAPAGLVHLACHSFTPELNGRIRQADLGLLYDPSRPAECQLVDWLITGLREHLPGWRVRRNYPYRGIANGLGQQHRHQFPPQRLVTIELEVNARHVLGRSWARDRKILSQACGQALRTFGRG